MGPLARNRRSMIGTLFTGAALAAVPLANAQVILDGPIRNPANGNVYFRLGNTNWTDAESFAVNSLGAHLVTINDAAENQFVRTAFSATALWLGLSDVGSEGNFAWADGSASTYRNWNAFEPNNGGAGGNEDYVYMLRGSVSSNLQVWNDASNGAIQNGDPVFGVVEVPCNMSILQTSIDFDSGKYYFYLSSSSWSCAQMYASQVLGLNLATINDAGENNAVRNGLLAFGFLRGWIGLTDRTSEGSFTWVDGSTSTFTSWAPGEPNNLNDEDFAIITNSAVWSDAQDKQFPPGAGSSTAVVEGNCPSISVAALPVVYPSTGHTYVRLTPAPWSCAEAYARSLGYHLASINDDPENSFLRTRLFPASGVLGFGLNDYTTEGTWSNMYGDLALYNNWAPGEPNNFQNEDFASMSSNGQWNDINNAVHVHGVVEIPFTINDHCADAIAIPSSGGSALGSPNFATSDGSSNCNIGTFRDVWYSYTPTAFGLFRINAAASSGGFAGTLSVHSSCPGTSANQLACSGGSNATVNVVMSPGQTYYLRVAGTNNATGGFTISVTPLSNDTCSNIPFVGSGDQTIPFDNSNGSIDGPTEAGCNFGGNTQIFNDYWYAWRAATSQRAVVTICPTASDRQSRVAVYQGIVCPTTPSTAMYCSLANGSTGCPVNGILAQTSFVAAPNANYTIRAGTEFGFAMAGNLILRTYCLADLDNGSGSGFSDGGVTIDDLLYYLQVFEAGDLAADVDDGGETGTPDGGVTIDDLLFYLQRFEAGC